ncbi:MAG: hypothetical protein AMJ43_02985 [Coxiella sp. DG_40]|nr:MAG: hypothetical protein AMJ43_02985 [Coxiella sp. DG_40]
MQSGKLTKRTNKSTKNSTPALQIVVQGIVGLIKQQMQFADEVGLDRQRIFPIIYEYLEDDNLENKLEVLFKDGENNSLQLQSIFRAIKNHQLVLTAALDGVALQTIKVLEARILSDRSLRKQLQTIFNSKKPIATSLLDFKHNQQARYRELVIPGFINTYMQIQAIGEKE